MISRFLPSPKIPLYAVLICIPLMMLAVIFTPIELGRIFPSFMILFGLAVAYGVIFEIYRRKVFPDRAIPCPASVTRFGLLDIGFRNITFSYHLGGKKRTWIKEFPSKIVEQLVIGQPAILLVDPAFPDNAEWDHFESASPPPSSDVRSPNHAKARKSGSSAPATRYLLSIILIVAGIGMSYIGYDAHRESRTFDQLLQQKGEEAPGIIISAKKEKSSKFGVTTSCTCTLEVIYQQRMHQSTTTKKFTVSEGYFDSKVTGGQITEPKVTVSYVPQRTDGAMLKGSAPFFPDYLVYFIGGGFLLLFGANEIRSCLNLRPKKTTN